MRDKVAQKTYLTRRVKGDSTRKAAKAAKISHATAIRAEKDPRIKSAMARALEKVGCTERHIAQVVYEGTKADKVISANIIAKSGEGMADAHSMTKDFIEVPDHPSRIKAAELAGKFRGDFTEKVEHSGQVAVVEVVKFGA